jgi:hypothetical protein
MAWLYEKSATWRRIVAFTSRSPLAMASFAAVTLGGTALLGARVQRATDTEGSPLEAQLRARGSVDAQMLARAQRDRLQVLLDEVRDRKAGGGAAAAGDARYAAALDGRSLGTHTLGTTVGARSIAPSGGGGKAA